jgi:hypothetical protein
MLTRPWQLLIALLASGCGASEPSVSPPGETLPTYHRYFGPVEPQLFLTVVDDHADAAELRATVARTFEQMDAVYAIQNASCIPPFDPAAYHPVDRTLLIVHPSAGGSDRYTNELDLPALRWRENQQTQVAHDAWARAVTQALEPKVAASDPFTALAAYERALSLVSSGREPESDVEAAILDALPARYRTTLLVALGRDDESGGEAAAYAVPLGSNVDGGPVILPTASPLPARADCYARDVTSTPRYESWVEAQGFYSVGHWPCSDETFIPEVHGDCGRGCLSFSPVRDAAGTAACKVLVTMRDDAPCPTEYGWLDPEAPDGERAPRTTRDAEGDHRVCEIRQLTGAALESCVTSLECPDCEPGWCATDVPELIDGCRQAFAVDDHESSGEHPNRFRFVHGADRAAHGRAAITCER